MAILLLPVPCVPSILRVSYWSPKSTIHRRQAPINDSDDNWVLLRRKNVIGAGQRAAPVSGEYIRVRDNADETSLGCISKPLVQKLAAWCAFQLFYFSDGQGKIRAGDPYQ